MNYTATIDVAAITVPKDRLRLVDEEKVAELARSIQDHDLLLNPIIVRKMKDERYRLLAGEHRLEAFKLLGRDAISAVVRPEVNGVRPAEDRLIEIDENLARSDLSDGETKLFRKRRKELMESEALADGLSKRKAAAAANQKLAAAAQLSEKAIQQQIKEAGQIERIAQWAGVDSRAVARSSIQSRHHLAAATKIIDTYGAGMRVETGNVHELLRKAVRKAAKGDKLANLVEFKAAVDKELRREELNSKRAKEETERLKHHASLLSKASKLLLDTTDAMTEDVRHITDEGRKAKELQQIDRLNRIARELDQVRSGMHARRAART